MGHASRNAMGQRTSHKEPQHGGNELQIGAQTA
jgi:hypothetical protein